MSEIRVLRAQVALITQAVEAILAGRFARSRPRSIGSPASSTRTRNC